MNEKIKCKILGKYFFFYGAEFSNFYPCNIKVDMGGEDVVLPTSEHYFMLFKAIHFNDMKSAIDIINAGHPAEAKKLGRKVLGFDKRKWEEVRYNYMLTACKAKFTQNLDLRELLLRTQDLILVEASPSDCIWGIGRGLDYPFLENEEKWLGDNLLGRVLMQVRKELQHG